MVKKIKRILANRNYKTKRNYLIKQGAKIGAGTRLNCKVSAFGTEPYLVSVGENCLFAYGVQLITHDGGIKVLNTLDYYGDGCKYDKIAPIKIGNNVYIGMDAFIMPGVVIGNNCIIGAKSVVTHDIPDNSVAVGIPARIIRTIDEYAELSKKKGSLYPTPTLSTKEKKEYFSKIFKN